MDRASPPPKSGVATRVFELMGGAKRVSEVLGIHYNTVKRWEYPKERNGRDGFIPPASAQQLMDWSRENGGPLKPEHFFDDVREVAAAE